MRLFDIGLKMDININPKTKVVKRANDLSNIRNCGRLLKFINPPRIVSRHALVSKIEKRGDFSDYFDDVMESAVIGEKTFEQAEVEMFRRVIEAALNKANLTPEDIDILVGGDLLNQITSANFSARYFDIPYFGVYSACATMVESLLVASIMLDAGFADFAACVTGSHFATAERMYRGPLELGLQRQQYAQHTVTAAACTLLGMVDKGIRITAGVIGKVEDYGVTDVANMGACMAPAAMSTFVRFFKGTDTSPDDYDLIVTGDLGRVGAEIFRTLMYENGYKIGQNYMDCGASIYSNCQHLCAGGSGAGCVASILNTYVLDKMSKGVYKKVLVGATGALMSLTTHQQCETMPAITHLVLLEAE